jgi:alkanesulfonate monooxygenase SsuD/methylene tetrahydromethanopterin reductase-like flavin-dependent oxidoreductase (luciferase family)
MPRKLAIMVPWQFEMRREDAIDLARIADEAGVHSFWVPEGWGRDAFSLLISLAEKTERIQLATGIVNVYSRSPGALAQHAATLDEWSGGRAILGLGASSANVIEQFHGIPFQPAMARMRETVAIVRMLLRGERLVHKGKWFEMDRGFTLRMNRVRSEIPIFLATLNPKSVKMTAEIADGWMPAMVPSSAMGAEIAKVRNWAREAGRDPSRFEVKAGSVTVSERPEARDAGRAFIAYYIARMGSFYYDQLVRFGFEDEASLVKRTFQEHGSAAAAAAIPTRLVEELGFAGSAEACRDRILEQERQGIDIHGISLDTREPRAFAKAVDTLLR